MTGPGGQMNAGGKTWLTAAELAELRLPGLPRVKRKVNERAADERWALRTDDKGAPLARPRRGRGGGLEYHVSLLPASARVELVKRGLGGAADVSTAGPVDAEIGRAASWSWYEGQSDAAKAEAMRRLRLIERVERLEAGNLTRSASVACAAAESGTASSTLWQWIALVSGVDRSDRLPQLAPRRTGGGHEADVDEDAFKFLISDYLRPERPTWSSCYRRMVDEYARPRGIAVPCSRTMLRKMEREIDGRLVIAKREGADALRKTLPPQQRSVAELSALELVNIDGHKFDVFVRFPDGRVGRPMMVAIQDVFSRKMLAWRIGETESAVMTRLAFADLFSKWGIPAGCVLDNGRAFASKWITGGAKTRFRFKIREEEPTGILTALGIRIHWAQPYRGQSKPIERAFRDLCDTIARHPALAGAYTGNHIDAKPENYGSRAVPIDVFAELVERGIAAHNARQGRRSEMAAGRSFDDVFEASYIRHPVGKASPEQLRLALLAADEVSADRQSGAIALFGNRYWSPELSGIAGKKVTVRFDPDDLTQAVHVYDRTGRFLASAPVLEQTGFLDAGAAGHRARQERELKKTVRRLGELEELINASDLAAMMPDYEDEGTAPSPTVLRPVRHRGLTAAALKPEPTETASAAFIDQFTAAERRLRVVND
jgi:putative transposase